MSFKIRNVPLTWYESLATFSSPLSLRTSIKAITISFNCSRTILRFVLIYPWWLVLLSSIKLYAIDIANIGDESVRRIYYAAESIWLRDKTGKETRLISKRKHNSRPISGILRMISVPLIRILFYICAVVTLGSAKTQIVSLSFDVIVITLLSNRWNIFTEKHFYDYVWERVRIWSTHNHTWQWKNLNGSP